MDQPPAQVQQVLHSQHEKEVVAATLIAEAGGEQSPGMQAVLNVIVNRTKGDISRIRQVCLTPFAFSSWNGKTVDSVIGKAKQHPCWSQALLLVEQGLQGTLPDITGGANHYYDPKRVQPVWARKMRQTAVIGGHTFLRDSK